MCFDLNRKTDVTGVAAVRPAALVVIEHSENSAKRMPPKWTLGVLVRSATVPIQNQMLPSRKASISMSTSVQYYPCLVPVDPSDQGTFSNIATSASMLKKLANGLDTSTQRVNLTSLRPTHISEGDMYSSFSRRRTLQRTNSCISTTAGTTL